MGKAPELKRCTRCHLDKPLHSFELLKNGKSYRGYCHRCRTGKPSLAAKDPILRQDLEGSRRLIITSAQNATPVHEAFFKTLQVAAQHLKAELVIIPLRYKNPTSQWTQRNQDHEWWAEEVIPYLHNQRKKLNDNLVLLGDIKTIPTASSPLTGFEGITGKESCILGHTKMQFKTVPVPTSGFPKILTTTGSCTKTNYTDSKSGKLGKFHHFLGAIIVEIQNSKIFHIRQLNADKQDGSFIDLDKRYTEKGVSSAPPALGLIMGDTHARWIDPRVEEATFGTGGMVETLNPETLVWHDLCDNYAANPHHIGNPFFGQAKLKGKIGDMRKEVEHAIEFARVRSQGRKGVIVASNHDDFLARAVVRSLHNGFHDPLNLKFLLETALVMAESVQVTGGGAKYTDAFQHWVRKLAPELHAAELDESVKVGDIECGMHGHIGPGGAQGSLKNLSRVGGRVIIGHGHGPGVEEGGYQVGKSTGRQEYEHGPDRTLQTHCVVYANGKRSLLNIIFGDWRLP